MKRVLSLILSLALIFALAVAGASTAEAASDKVIELKLGHPLAPTSSQHIYLQKWADLVAEKSGGKYKISIYPSAQFGEAKELVESLSLGVYDVAWCDCAVMDFLVPEINLLNMPFFFTNYDQVWEAIDGDVGSAIAAYIEQEANIHPLSYFNLGCRQIFSNREPVTSLESIKNLKFRVPELDLWIKTFKTLGMNPTPVAWSDLYNALATGVVDGGCANWEYICQQKFYSEAPYILESNHFFQLGVPSFNLSFWNSLSPEDQAMFTETCAQAAAEQREYSANLDAEYKTKIVEDKGTITPISEFKDYDEVIQRYKDGLWQEIVEKANAQDLYEIMCTVCGR